MKINFSTLDEPIQLSNFTVLAIEDVDVFSKIILDIYNYDEGTDFKIFDNQYKNIKKEELLLVTDILGFDINSRIFIKEVYQDLEKQLNEELYKKSKVQELIIEITELIENELIDHELNLESEETTFQDLFKFLGIRIETSAKTINEKIYQIIEVFKYLNKKKILIFINCLSYLNSEQSKSLKEFCELLNTNILFIEPKKINNSPQYVLDKDYFLYSES
jgi:CRISPR-associated protein Csn2